MPRVRASLCTSRLLLVPESRRSGVYVKCGQAASERNRRAGGARRPSFGSGSRGEGVFGEKGDGLQEKERGGGGEPAPRPPIKKFRITILPQPDRAKT